MVHRTVVPVGASRDTLTHIPQCVVVDLNCDGSPDVAISGLEAPAALVVFGPEARRTASYYAPWEPNEGETFALIEGDINLDGFKDLIIATGGSRLVAWWDKAGRHQVAFEEQYKIVGVIGDITGDGLGDLVAESGEDAVAWILSSASGEVVERLDLSASFSGLPRSAVTAWATVPGDRSFWVLSDQAAVLMSEESLTPILTVRAQPGEEFHRSTICTYQRGCALLVPSTSGIRIVHPGFEKDMLIEAPGRTYVCDDWDRDGLPDTCVLDGDRECVGFVVYSLATRRVLARGRFGKLGLLPPQFLPDVTGDGLPDFVVVGPNRVAICSGASCLENDG